MPSWLLSDAARELGEGSWLLSEALQEQREGSWLLSTAAGELVVGSQLGDGGRRGGGRGGQLGCVAKCSSVYANLLCAGGQEELTGGEHEGSANPIRRCRARR